MIVNSRLEFIILKIKFKNQNQVKPKRGSIIFFQEKKKERKKKKPEMDMI
jgi:hypothetical protein